MQRMNENQETKYCEILCNFHLQAHNWFDARDEGEKINMIHMVFTHNISSKLVQYFFHFPATG
jgi:hypothetical protein